MDVHAPRKAPGSLLRRSLGLGLLFALGWLALYLIRPAQTPPPAHTPLIPLSPPPTLAQASPAPPALAPKDPVILTDPADVLREFLWGLEDCDCPELLGPFFAKNLTSENAHDFLALLQQRDQWQEIAVFLTFWAKLDPREAFLTTFHHLSAEHYETSAPAMLDLWMSQADPEAVLTQLNRLNDPDRIALLLGHLAKQAETLEQAQLQTWLARWTEPRLRAEAEYALFSVLAQNDPQRGAALFASEPGFQLGEILPLILSRQWMLSDPAAATAWTLTLPPEMGEAALAEGIGALGLTDPLRAEQTLDRFLETTPADQRPFSADPALFELVLVLARTKPEQAARWHSLITNPDLREAGRQLLAQR